MNSRDLKKRADPHHYLLSSFLRILGLRTETLTVGAFEKAFWIFYFAAYKSL